MNYNVISIFLLGVQVLMLVFTVFVPAPDYLSHFSIYSYIGTTILGIFIGMFIGMFCIDRGVS